MSINKDLKRLVQEHGLHNLIFEVATVADHMGFKIGHISGYGAMAYRYKQVVKKLDEASKLVPNGGDFGEYL